jgi:hypothetical protein
MSVMFSRSPLLLLCAAACVGPAVDVVVSHEDGDAAGEGEGEGEGDSAGEGEGEAVVVGAGTFDDPIVVDEFPFHDARDTRDAPGFAADAYACDEDLDEGGRAFVYRLDVGDGGLVGVHVDDGGSDDGVDVDVHLLSAPSAASCLARDNRDLSFVVDPSQGGGSVWLVVDSYVDGGVAQEGAYAVDVSVTPLTGGDCAVVPRELEMVWSACAGSIAGCEERVDGVFLQTPVTGPTVLEAHLVTVDEGFADDVWPTSFTDGIPAHYARTASATGYQMERDQPWCPAGEGGSELGQGSARRPPVVDEAWYVNMYWRDKPAPGTRMIIKNPANGRAVVASAGWETGPGSNARAGGVSEEVHDWLGSGHGDVLVLGFAADQALPFGPIDCAP